jgi:phytoene synthase
MYSQAFASKTRLASQTFYTLTLFFPKAVREEVFTLYAFVRTADDLVDSEPPQKAAFAKFRQDTFKALLNKHSSNQLINAFAELVERRQIPKGLVEDFFSGLSLDLSPQDYKTHFELQKFLYGVAGVIGRMLSYVLGVHQSSMTASEVMGNALQMVNIIRDLSEDYTRWKRVYIPVSVRAKYGWSWPIEKKYALQQQARFSRMVRFEIDYAKGLLNQAKPELQAIPKKYRAPVVATWHVYSWVLGKIYSNPLIVFEKKLKPTKPVLVSYLVQSYLETYLWK